MILYHRVRNGSVNQRTSNKINYSLFIKYQYFLVYVIGGNIIDYSDSRNNFVEVIDTKSGEVSQNSNVLFPSANGGLSFACLVALPEEDAFVITGGEVYRRYG